MKMEHHLKSCTRNKNKLLTIKFITISFFTLFLVVILLHIQYSSPFDISLSARSQTRRASLFQENYSNVIEVMTYCFEKAVVMRHEMSQMGQENKLKTFDLLRCKARSYCGINPAGKGREINERGFPIIRLTLLMRRGSRSFKNATVVTNIFSKECSRVEGCILHVVQSDDISFCDQVKELTNTDIVASPCGAQLTNMLFMDRESSVMEFYPKGWLEYAGSGQYAYHWMANQSGMKHQGAWWDPVGEECPSPQDQWQCFSFHKDGMVGHNETYFAEWARRVIDQVRLMKQEQASADQANKQQHDSKACVC